MRMMPTMNTAAVHAKRAWTIPDGESSPHGGGLFFHLGAIDVETIFPTRSENPP